MIHKTQNSTVIILAGGFGTRLRAVVQDVPKPMAPINDRPFLEFQLLFLEESGVQNVVIATGYKADVISDHFGHAFRSLKLRYSHENEPLGTGGGLIKAAGLVSSVEPLFVMNGDTFFPISLTDMLESHQVNKADITMAMMKIHERGRYSPFDIAPNGRLSIGSDGASVHKSAGIYLFSQEMVSDLQARRVERLSFEDDLTPLFLDADLHLFAYVADVPFIDIGVPDDYHRAGLVIDQYVIENPDVRKFQGVAK